MTEFGRWGWGLLWLDTCIDVCTYKDGDMSQGIRAWWFRASDCALSYILLFISTFDQMADTFDFIIVGGT